MKHQSAFWFKFIGLIACSFVLIFQADFSGRAAGPWYVSPDGEDANSCQSPGDPCATINGALGKAAAGDTIYVAGGTYTAGDELATEVLLINKSITLSGGWDLTFTIQEDLSILDGEDVRTVIIVSNGITVIIERFVIQHGYSVNWGAGIYNDHGNLTLIESQVRENVSYYETAGIFNNAGNLTLEHSKVNENWSQSNTYGTGIYTYEGIVSIHSSEIIDNLGEGPGIKNVFGQVVMANSTISGNTQGIYNNGTMYINNCTISGNTSYLEGGGIYNDDYLMLSSSTVTGNSASFDGGGIYSFSSSTLIVKNSIIAGNFSPFNGANCFGPVSSSGYNLIGETAGCEFTSAAGDLIGFDPDVSDLIGSPGYRPLLEVSSAIDAGNPAGCTNHEGDLLVTDQRGASRVGRCDIGAYEYTVPGAPASITVFAGTPQQAAPGFEFRNPFKALVQDELGSPVSGVPVSWTAPVSGPSGTFSDSGTITTTAVTNESGIATAPAFTANDLKGSYTLTATVTGTPSTIAFILGNTAWYVSTSGDDRADCQTPASPCYSIPGAVAKQEFSPGDTVFIASGVYTSSSGSEVVLLEKDAVLLGGWDELFTAQEGLSTIDGEAVRAGIMVVASTVSVENFVIRNCTSPSVSAIRNYAGNVTLKNFTINENSQGYVTVSNYFGSMNIIDSEIRNNDAEGLGNYRGQVIVTNSSISDNSDGGVDNSGWLFMNNSTISSNGAEGVTNNNFAYLSNCTITNNTYGIWEMWLGNITIQNSIVADNGLKSSDEFYGTIKSAGYNLIGRYDGYYFIPLESDLLNVNPKLFALTGSPGYHPLLYASPAIDAGNPSGCFDHLGNLMDTDQRGVARVGRCDIGAYEYDPAQDPTEYVFLPANQRAWECTQGICGRVFLNGTLIEGITLELRYYNGSNWSTKSTTTTNANGEFSFLYVNSLYPGEMYYVLFRNTQGIPGRLWVWATRPIISYQHYSALMIGEFDIADINLISPPFNSTVALPYTFQWARRPATIGDSYEFNLYDWLDGDPWFYTAPLGYVDSYTLSSLPPGFGTKTPYIWEMWVYSADGGYGISNSYGVVTFSNTGSSLMRMEPARPKLETDLELWLGR